MHQWNQPFRCSAFVTDEPIPTAQSGGGAKTSFAAAGAAHDTSSRSSRAASSTNLAASAATNPSSPWASDDLSSCISVDEPMRALMTKNAFSLRYRDPRMERMYVHYCFNRHAEVVWWCALGTIGLCLAVFTDSDAVRELYYFELMLAAVNAALGFVMAVACRNRLFLSGVARPVLHEYLIAAAVTLLNVGITLPMHRHRATCTLREAARSAGVLFYCMRFFSSITTAAKLQIMWKPPRVQLVAAILLVTDVCSMIGMLVIPQEPQMDKTWMAIPVALMNFVISVGLLIFVFARESMQRGRMEATVRRYQHQQIVARRRAKLNTLISTMIPPSALEALIVTGNVLDFARGTMSIADICGFTQWSSRRSPMQVIHMLNTVMVALDNEAAHCGVRKLGTVGDSFRACANIPEACIDHSLRILDFAQRTHLVFVRISRVYRDLWGELRCRVGAHTGSLCGAVVGRSSHTYDLYGPVTVITDALQTACRPGDTMVSAVTFEEATSCLALDGGERRLSRGSTRWIRLFNGTEVEAFHARVHSNNQVRFSARVTHVAGADPTASTDAVPRRESDTSTSEGTDLEVSSSQRQTRSAGGSSSAAGVTTLGSSGGAHGDDLAGVGGGAVATKPDAYGQLKLQLRDSASSLSLTELDNGGVDAPPPLPGATATPPATRVNLRSVLGQALPTPAARSSASTPGDSGMVAVTPSLDEDPMDRRARGSDSTESDDNDVDDAADPLRHGDGIKATAGSATGGSQGAQGATAGVVSVFGTFDLDSSTGLSTALSSPRGGGHVGGGESLDNTLSGAAEAPDTDSGDAPPTAAVRQSRLPSGLNASSRGRRRRLSQFSHIMPASVDDTESASSMRGTAPTDSATDGPQVLGGGGGGGGNGRSAVSVVHMNEHDTDDGDGLSSYLAVLWRLWRNFNSLSRVLGSEATDAERADFYKCCGPLLRNDLVGAGLLLATVSGAAIVCVFVEGGDKNATAVIAAHGAFALMMLVVVAAVAIVTGPACSRTFRQWRSKLDDAHYEARRIALLAMVFLAGAALLVVSSFQPNTIISSTPSFVATVLLMVGPLLSVPTAASVVPFVIATTLCHIVVTVVQYGVWLDSITFILIVCVGSLTCCVTRAKGYLRFYTTTRAVERVADAVRQETRDMERVLGALIPPFIVTRFVRKSERISEQPHYPLVRGFMGAVSVSGGGGGGGGGGGAGSSSNPLLRGSRVPSAGSGAAVDDLAPPLVPVPFADDHPCAAVLFFHFAIDSCETSLSMSHAASFTGSGGAGGGNAGRSRITHSATFASFIRPAPMPGSPSGSPPLPALLSSNQSPPPHGSGQLPTISPRAQSATALSLAALPSPLPVHTGSPSSTLAAPAFSTSGGGGGGVLAQGTTPPHSSLGLRIQIPREHERVLRDEVNRLAGVMLIADDLLYSRRHRHRWPLLEKIKLVNNSLLIAGPLGMIPVPGKDGSNPALHDQRRRNPPSPGEVLLGVQNEELQSAARNPMLAREGARQALCFAVALWDRLRANASTRDLHISAGLDFGPVVAGVVGVDHIKYDIFSSTVNTASRVLTCCAMQGRGTIATTEEFYCQVRGLDSVAIPARKAPEQPRQPHQPQQQQQQQQHQQRGSNASGSGPAVGSTLSASESVASFAVIALKEASSGDIAPDDGLSAQSSKDFATQSSGGGGAAAAVSPTPNRQDDSQPASASVTTRLLWTGPSYIDAKGVGRKAVWMVNEASLPGP